MKKIKWLKKINAINIAFLLLMATCQLSYGHPEHRISVYDAVESALEYLKSQMNDGKLQSLTPAEALPLLSEEERHALATQYISFKVNQPVIVSIARDTRWLDQPFWLKSENFKPTGEQFEEAGTTFDIWEKTFDLGEVGLGINSLTGGGIHYVVTVRPQEPHQGLPLEIFHAYPRPIRLNRQDDPLKPYLDNNYTLREMPETLSGQFVQVLYDRRDVGKILNVLHETQFPATNQPDQWVLTWSSDPATTQTFQWRTNTQIEQMKLRVVAAEKPLEEESGKGYTQLIKATPLHTPEVINDPLVHRYQATFSNLMPNSTYRYGYQLISQENKNEWVEVGEFTTALNSADDFSFIYLGDAQNGLETWGQLIEKSVLEHDEARFILMAGDLVNRGNDRDDWDLFFNAGRSVFSKKTLVPVIGNHENQGGYPGLYLSLFNLLDNGPKTLTPERAYTFNYGNALFVVLDSNLPLTTQTTWLESVLKSTKAQWKFVSYHHPAYPSSDRAVNPDFQKHWLPLFDRYEVDFALQGHDHAYLRTYPIRDGKAYKEASEEKDQARSYVGTRYLISVSGEKMYPQKPSNYIEKGFVKVATYQVFQLKVKDNRLVYQAYDKEANLRDELTIVKQ